VQDQSFNKICIRKYSWKPRTDFMPKLIVSLMRYKTHTRAENVRAMTRTGQACATAMCRSRIRANNKNMFVLCVFFICCCIAFVLIPAFGLICICICPMQVQEPLEPTAQSSCKSCNPDRLATRPPYPIEHQAAAVLQPP
jgi:hypothetical protein